KAVTLRHTLCNTSSRPVWINAAATGQFARSASVPRGKGNILGWDLRFCHTDNVRTEKYPHSQMEYPYARMLPPETVVLGRGEDQALPAVFIKDLIGKNGLVVAAASQELHYTAFEMRKRAEVNEKVNDSAFDHFAVLHDPGQGDGFEVPAGGSLALDGVFIQVTGDISYEDAFADYLGFLAGRFNFRGKRTPLLRHAFHCTWNYGVFDDQSEKSLLPTASFIAKNFPNIKYFLMDDGYLRRGDSQDFLSKFYPDPLRDIESSKWPRGIRGFTDELRRLGLRPGLWWSPTVRASSQLHADHPDWFLRNADGSLYLIGEANGCLDFSHPEALAFLDRTLAVILGEWGMDACKIDFWSHTFEDRHARLRDPSQTSAQARARFFETVRKNLPPDGVLMTCVAMGMGNPFNAQWADSYRCTIDIGVGTWDAQIYNCAWALPMLGFEGRKTFLPNFDSAGVMAEYPDNENYFRLTWGFINMGLLETGGRMETWPEKWVKAMRKLTDRCDRGYRCRCPDDRAFTGVPLPEVLYVDYPDGSPTAAAGVRQSLALFNWNNEPRLIAVRRHRLGHAGPARAVNFWTGEEEEFNGEFLCKRLEGRSALLYDVTQ
ncbi:MAG: alpha-galactosidase, partial [Kiritimatiellae bacterium]|nr:alpha-galactosidase [Kiritimatiellia bacterium]